MSEEVMLDGQVQAQAEAPLDPALIPEYMVPEPKKRPRGNPAWVKGVSGNPTGMPQKYKDLAALARTRTPDALQRIFKLMNSKNERVALLACQEVLNRGYGKPYQAVGVEGDGVAPITYVVTGVIRGPSDSYTDS